MKKFAIILLLAVLTATVSFGQSFYSEKNWADEDSTVRANILKETNVDSLNFDQDFSVKYNEVTSVTKYIGVPSRSGKLIDQYYIIGMINQKEVKNLIHYIPCVKPEEMKDAGTVRVGICKGAKWGDDLY